MDYPDNRNYTTSDHEIFINTMDRLIKVIGALDFNTHVDNFRILADMATLHGKAESTVHDMLYVLTKCSEQKNPSAANCYLRQYFKGYSLTPSEWQDFPSGSVQPIENRGGAQYDQPSDSLPKDSTTFSEALGYKIGRLIPVLGFSIASTMIARFVSPYSWTSVFAALLSAGYLFVFLRDRLNGKLASERKAA